MPANNATQREFSPALALAKRIDQGILLFSQGLGLIVIVVLFLAVFAGVLLRYVSDQGAAWVNELPYLLFPWLCASGIVIAAQMGAHILVEFLLHLLPRRGARALIIITQMMTVGLFSFLTWQGLAIVEMTSIQRYPSLGLPTSYGYSALVVACSLLALTAFTTLLLALFSQQAPEKLRKSETASEEMQ
ncbi:TRAP-type C4-dicarboxylate transport system, small permease component [Halomonas citrativorans]|uniref:TRAP transporter small permease protein n=1 Tax=Halomonas citrativorans TaxID=2742612 RepID=A0A1R4HV44_9GAMM|nr:TRAP transporter small permease [Halomonas citrativorans]SJN11427.1 TRAP-type C4-dicarboxylate transport system, small permease component [Halomonas citrativorans]